LGSWSPPHRIFHNGTFQPSPCCVSPPSARPFFDDDDEVEALREGTDGEEVFESEPKLLEREVERVNGGGGGGGLSALSIIMMLCLFLAPAALFLSAQPRCLSQTGPLLVAVVNQTPTQTIRKNYIYF
jgi:hypothetical protein